MIGDPMTKNSTIFAFLIAVALLDTSAGVAADIRHGEQLAQRWCASCHLVPADQRQVTTEAPPFATVAHRPDFDTNRLAFFLLDPHPKMPNMSLTRLEATDIAAYIGSLAR
jgi:mono/diheme cytochrome c family protein